MPEIFDRPPMDTPLAEEFDETLSGLHHNSNLYDQNEDPNGDIIDLATGKAIDNTSIEAEATLPRRVSAKELSSLDKDMKGDDADKWLKENDPDYNDRLAA